MNVEEIVNMTLLKTHVNIIVQSIIKMKTHVKKIVNCKYDSSNEKCITKEFMNSKRLCSSDLNDNDYNFITTDRLFNAYNP